MVDSLMQCLLVVTIDYGNAAMCNDCDAVACGGGCRSEQSDLSCLDRPTNPHKRQITGNQKCQECKQTQDYIEHTQNIFPLVIDCTFLGIPQESLFYTV